MRVDAEVWLPALDYIMRVKDEAEEASAHNSNSKNDKKSRIKVTSTKPYKTSQELDWEYLHSIVEDSLHKQYIMEMRKKIRIVRNWQLATNNIFCDIKQENFTKELQNKEGL